MIKRYLTTKFDFGEIVNPPIDIEHKLEPDAEYVRFYFNLGGRIGDFEVPANINIDVTGVVDIYISTVVIPDGLGITQANVPFGDVYNSPSWEVHSVKKFEKSYNKTLGSYGNIVYYVDVDISQIGGNFQLAAFCKILGEAPIVVPPDVTDPTLGEYAMLIPSVSDVSANSAVASWVTTEPASTKILYGDSISNLSNEIIDLSLTIVHKKTLVGLQLEVTYYARFYSQNEAGIWLNSNIISFVAGKEITVISEITNPIVTIIKSNIDKIINFELTGLLTEAYTTPDVTETETSLDVAAQVLPAPAEVTSTEVTMTTEYILTITP